MPRGRPKKAAPAPGIMRGGLVARLRKAATELKGSQHAEAAAAAADRIEALEQAMQLVIGALAAKL